MGRPLLPPRGVFVPTSILYDLELSATVRDTWAQLRGLAWGQNETPELSPAQITSISGKSQSVVYGHLAMLRAKGALRWRSSRHGTLIFTFYDSQGFSGNQENCSDESEGEAVIFQDSGNQESLDSPPSLIPPQTKVKEGGKFLNSGKKESRKIPSKKSDPRTKHPAIQLFREITGNYPARVNYDELITIWGESPNEISATDCYKEWCRRGYNSRSLIWAVEWYKLGIPQNGRNDDRHNPAPVKKPPECDNPSVESALEYLRMNPRGSLRDGALKRMKEHGYGYDDGKLIRLEEHIEPASA
jgi:hypothetical protein